MSMQVLVLRPHPSRGRGMQRLSSLVRRAWTEAGAQVVAVAAPATVSSRMPWKGAGRGLAAMESAAWFGQQLHKHVDSADLVVVVDPRDAVYTSQIAGKVPVCVICHDLSGLLAAVGESTARRAGAVDRLKAPFVIKALQRADHVLCTSEAAARAVRRLTEHAPTVLHLPVDESVVPRTPAVRLRTAPAWPYLLSVDSGGRQARRDAVISTWINLRRTAPLDGASLVIVGPPLAADEQHRVNACGGHVEVLQDVDDEHLGALYSGARAVLCLGSSGGFAWPIAEAHAAGRPVLAADGEDYEEVGADGCVYVPVEGVDRFDEAAWQALAADLMSTGLLARARANAGRFDWRSFADRLPAASVPPRIARAAARSAAAAPPVDVDRSADDLEVVDRLEDLSGFGGVDTMQHWLHLDHDALTRHLPDQGVLDLRDLDPREMDLHEIDLREAALDGVAAQGFSADDQPGGGLTEPDDGDGYADPLLDAFDDREDEDDVLRPTALVVPITRARRRSGGSPFDRPPTPRGRRERVTR